MQDTGRATDRLGGISRQATATSRVLRAVLRSQALRRVLAAFLLFNASVYGTWVAVLVYAYGATGPASVGIVGLVQLLPAAAFAPVAAVFVDHHPRERVLAAGYAAQAATFGLVAIGMLAGLPAVVVYAAAAAGAAATTLTRPAQGSLLPGLSRTPEELTAANSLAGTVEGIGVLLGPLGAALVLAVASPGVAWAAGSLAGLVATLLVVGVARNTPRPAAGHAGEGEAETGAAAPIVQDGPGSRVTSGLRALAGNGETRLIVALLAVRMASFGAIDVLFVLLALDVLQMGDAGAGLLTGALGLGTVLGGAASLGLVGRQRLAPAMVVSALGWGVAMVLAAVAGRPGLAIALIAGAGVGFAALDVSGRTILQRVTPDRLLARVLAALEGIGLLCLALGSVAVPVLAGAFGVTGALVVVALVLPAAVAAAWIPLRRIDRHAHVPLRELALLRRNPIFASLPPPQLEAVARRARWITPAPGETIIREGDPGDRFYVLESGALEVTQGGTWLRRLTDPGSGAGEIALLRDVARTATVRVDGPSVLLGLDRADFLAGVTGHDAALSAGREVADRYLAAGTASRTAPPTDRPAG
jgi:MFS family permease